MKDMQGNGGKREILAEKSSVTVTTLYAVSVITIILLLITGFQVKGFFDVIKYILFFLCLVFTVYFKFLCPKIAAEFDEKGIYINKPFNRTLFIEHKSVSYAEGREYRGRGNSLYDFFNKVGSVKIYIKSGGRDEIITLPFILNADSVSSIINILKDRYGKQNGKV